MLNIFNDKIKFRRTFVLILNIKFYQIIMKTFPKLSKLLVVLVIVFIIIVISREVRLVINKTHTNYQQKYHVRLPDFNLGNKLKF